MKLDPAQISLTHSPRLRTGENLKGESVESFTARLKSVIEAKQGL